MKELLTIAIPAYKRTTFIKYALDCAVKQSVSCQILLVDNNSPHEEFKKIVDSYNNPLIKYVRTDETVSMVENFNNCFKYADTPWVTILHDDDLLHFQFAELAQNLLNGHGSEVGGFAVQSHVDEKEWELIYKKVDFTDDIKIVKEPFFFFAQLTPFPGVVVNRDKALKIGGFDSKYYPMEDFDFWYRYCKTVPMLFVNQKMAYYRISPSQDTVDYIDVMVNDVYSYRNKLIKESEYNNLLSRIGLEYSRFKNIKYFKKTYPQIQFTKKLENENYYKIASMIFKVPYVPGLIRRYIHKISFSALKKTNRAYKD